MTNSGKMRRDLDARLGDTRLLLLVALGFGIVGGSSWSSRHIAPFGEAVAPYYTSLVGITAIVALIVAGILLKRRRPAEALVQPLFLVAAASFALHVVATALTLVFSDASGLGALALVSAFFEGVFYACAELAFLLALAPLTPCGIATGIALGYLVGTLYDCLIQAAPTPVVFAQWFIGQAGVLVVMWALRDNAGKEACEAGLETTPASEAAEQGADTRTLWAGLAPLLAFALVALLVRGTFAQLIGLGGMGESAFYGSLGSIVAIWLYLILLCACFFVGDRIRPDLVVLVSSAICATGLLLVAIGAEQGALIGALVLACGAYVIQTLVLSLGAQASFGSRPGAGSRPGTGGPLMMGVVAAIPLSSQVATLACQLATPQDGISLSALSQGAAFATWLTACVAAFALFAMGRRAISKTAWDKTAGASAPPEVRPRHQAPLVTWRHPRTSPPALTSVTRSCSRSLRSAHGSTHSAASAI